MNSEILQEILLKINYDPSKTLRENLELLEQPESVMDRRVGISATNAEALGLSQGDYEKQVQKEMSEKAKSFGEFISDPHVFLPLSAGIVTLATGGLAGVAIGAVLEAADVALYVKEKDYTSAGIGMIFSLIPAGMLFNKLGVGTIASQQIKVLISKLKKGLDLTNQEKKIIQAIDDNKAWIAKTLAKQNVKILTRSLLAKYTGKKLLIVILLMIKYGILPYRFGWRVAALGGGFFTAMQLGKMLGIVIQGLDYRNVEIPKNFEKLPKEKKQEIATKILVGVTEQSPEIKQNVKEEVKKISETSDTQKNQQIAKVLIKIPSELDEIIKEN